MYSLNKENQRKYTEYSTTFFCYSFKKRTLSLKMSILSTRALSLEVNQRQYSYNYLSASKLEHPHWVVRAFRRDRACSDTNVTGKVDISR